VYVSLSSSLTDSHSCWAAKMDITEQLGLHNAMCHKFVPDHLDSWSSDLYLKYFAFRFGPQVAIINGNDGSKSASLLIPSTLLKKV